MALSCRAPIRSFWVSWVSLSRISLGRSFRDFTVIRLPFRFSSSFAIVVRRALSVSLRPTAEPVARGISLVGSSWDFMRVAWYWV